MDLPTITTADLLVRLVVAAMLGAAIGFEREYSEQPAGLRTHLLVSLGACLFTLAGAYGLEAFSGRADLNFDPTRIAAQVVTGIGFLGAGAILREGVNIRGLTTAAALWVTAAVGLAVGLGFWAGAAAATAIAVIALYGLKRVEKVLFPRLRGTGRTDQGATGPP